MNNLEKTENSEQYPSNSEMLTFVEAFQYLKVSKSLLYKATSQRIIPFFKPFGGKLLYFSRKDLDEWLTQNRFSSKSELISNSHIQGKGGVI